MILETLTRPDIGASLLETLQRRAFDAENGKAGEDRLVLSGISWKQYLELDETLGHDRSDPRMYYLDGELEIMTTSFRHERIKSWLGGLLEDYLLHIAIEASPHGQATMRILKEAGAEPDESWCLGADKEWPDLVLEIALTSGGIPKLEIYRRFAVAEVWFWRRVALEIWILRRDQSGYDPAEKSRLLPKLDIATLTRCAVMENWREARLAYRKALAQKKPKG